MTITKIKVKKGSHVLLSQQLSVHHHRNDFLTNYFHKKGLFERKASLRHFHKKLFKLFSSSITFHCAIKKFNRDEKSKKIILCDINAERKIRTQHFLKKSLSEIELQNRKKRMTFFVMMTLAK